jgi:hypothetical protein
VSIRTLGVLTCNHRVKRLPEKGMAKSMESFRQEPH